jgi:hypothetical protein
MFTWIIPTFCTGSHVRATLAVPVLPPPVAVIVAVVVPGGSSRGHAWTDTEIDALPPAGIVPEDGVVVTMFGDDSEKLRLALLSLKSVSGFAGGALPPPSPLKLSWFGENRQAGVVPEPTVIVALADLVESATLVAVKTQESDATLGAVYVRVFPEPAIDPQLAVNVQVTDVFVAPDTDAVNDCVPPGASVAMLGLIDTTTDGRAA